MNVTRDQLLRAEIVVQLGNIVEKLDGMATGNGSARIAELEAQVANLTTSLEAAQAQVTALQGQSLSVGDTPDTIAEVFTKVGIQ